jgi:hypothetical protein
MQMGPASIAIRQADPETVERVAGSIGEALAPYRTPAGVAMPSASWIVTARRL